MKRDPLVGGNWPEGSGANFMDFTKWEVQLEHLPFWEVDMDGLPKRKIQIVMGQSGLSVKGARMCLVKL